MSRAIGEVLAFSVRDVERADATDLEGLATTKQLTAALDDDGKMFSIGWRIAGIPLYRERFRLCSIRYTEADHARTYERRGLTDTPEISKPVDWGQPFRVDSRLISGPGGRLLMVLKITAATTAATWEPTVLPQTFIPRICALRDELKAAKQRDSSSPGWLPGRGPSEASKVQERQAHLRSELWDALGFGAVVHSTNNLAEDPSSIPRLLAHVGAPLADDGVYKVTALDSDPANPNWLVEYVRPRGKRSLRERIDLAVDRLPAAFKTPLRSKVARPVREGSYESVLARWDGGPGALALPPDLLERELTPDDRRNALAARAAVVKNGTDALGWYQPFHEWNGDTAGIYLADTLIIALGLDIDHRLRDAGHDVGRRVAIWAVAFFVLEHERFHARLDQVTMDLELAARKPLYRRYARTAYRPSLKRASGALEEALAEHAAHASVAAHLQGVAVAYSSRSATDALAAQLLDLSASAPPGYRDHAIGADPKSARRLLAQVSEATVDPAPDPPSLEYLLLHADELASYVADVPVFVPTNGPFADGLLRPSKRRDLVRSFLNAGFVEDTQRGKGSHTVFRHVDGRRFTLPGHAEISSGVAREAEMLLNMTSTEFAEARRAGR